MKLVDQLRLSVILLVIFAIFNLGFIYVQIDQMTTDGRVVNFAGIVRGATQRLAKLELLGQPHPLLIEQLDQTINGLIVGDQKLGLPPAIDVEFSEKMKQVKSAWSPLKKTLQRSELTENEKKRLLQESENYWDLTNQAVFAAENFATLQVNRLKSKQIFLFSLNLTLLAFIGWKLTGNIKFQLLKAIQNLGISSTELGATVAEQERAAEQQALAMDETKVTLAHLGVSSEETAEETQIALRSAQKVFTLINQGSDTVERLLKEMNNLNQMMFILQDNINMLSQQITQINHISDLVSDLANQTNMLALNASMEATRTGMDGKGFGVVATEIRKLADRSKKSAREINLLIGEVLESIRGTVNLTQKGANLVKLNVEMTQETSQVFAGVSTQIDQMVGNNQEIFQNSQEQTQALQQVIEAMTDLKQAASEMALGISHIKLGAGKLNDAVLDLKTII